ncbi:phosphoadenosine phosphosulfate reductase family protein [Dehalococcoides mccartyi]|uniref:phosphoadenosine phosphosulfate reductase domain-containing protein n=1 Tax=Dehalococcoides mccartyi TaxID=61435 RepID=UPI00339B7EC1
MRNGNALLNDTINTIQREYLKDDLPWSLAFSGGKDSSALLKLVYVALQNIGKKLKPVTVVYCDTGVEIPIIRSFVIETLHSLQIEAEKNEIPIKTKIVTPSIEDKFFSKVIGRGYPSPTYQFRWCTDVLRIKPIRNYTNNFNGKSIVLLGIRNGESSERDRALNKYRIDDSHYFRQSNNMQALVFSPMLEYAVEDIWSVLKESSGPISIDVDKLQMFYRVLDSGNIKELTSASLFNSKGRFGCWVCTVVRRDRAVEGLITDGTESLSPLLEFRNWLSKIRYEPSYRLNKRRNGAIGLGPFTLDARREILDRLINAQNQTEWNLITEQEIEYIENQWSLDRNI